MTNKLFFLLLLICFINFAQIYILSKSSKISVVQSCLLSIFLHHHRHLIFYFTFYKKTHSLCELKCCKLNYKIDNNQELVVLLETDDSITLHQFILFQIILIILIHHSLIPHFQ